MKESFI